MCLLCYCCFLRPKEISMLRCSDIDLKKQLIKVNDDIAKNDNTSYRTIPDAMLPYMTELNLSVGSHYLFADGKGYDFLPGTKKVCSRKPDTDSAPPKIAASSILGMRMLNRILLSVESSMPRKSICTMRSG